MATSRPFFAVSTIKVKPENMAKVEEWFRLVAKETAEKEPAAKIYRFYKTEGKDEYVFMEKFESKEAYRAHQNSEHVQRTYQEYKQYLTEPFIFHFMDVQDECTGGFERE